jgi:hypothetical protein
VYEVPEVKSLVLYVVIGVGAAALVHAVPLDVNKLPAVPGVTPPVVVRIVPLVVGSVNVGVPATAGADMVTVPEVSPAITTDDIILLPVLF